MDETTAPARPGPPPGRAVVRGRRGGPSGVPRGGLRTGAGASEGVGERGAARAYLRLLEAVRAALDDRPGSLPMVLPLLAGPLAEADEALCVAGIAGNEGAFLRAVASQALGGGSGTPDP